MASEKQALVFGASGLAGWGVVDQLLRNYPSADTFTKITALVNRPLDLSKAQWPDVDASGIDFKLVSGINLTEETVDSFAVSLKKKLSNIESVTHVYYFAFKQEDDPELESQINCGMLERVVGALERFAPKLEFFFYPAGTRMYGINVPGGLHKAPLVESMTLDVSPDFSARVHYYAFDNLLRRASSGHRWTWCSAIPDAIIGFAPAGSTFSLPAHWATYLALHALRYGSGATVSFPGNAAGYRAKFSDVASTRLARFAIFASLHPDACGNGETFNIADSEAPSIMADHWPRLCTYFGLQGVPPTEETVSVSVFNAENAHLLDEHGLEQNTVFKAPWLDAVGYAFSFDRQLGLSKTRKAGFIEEQDAIQSWYDAFERFKVAGMIPK